MRDAAGTMGHPRQLSRLGKFVLLLLVTYAVVVILPDTLRPTAVYKLTYDFLGFLAPRSADSGWYPLGIACFTADNDGTVTSCSTRLQSPQAGVSVPTESCMLVTESISVTLR